VADSLTRTATGTAAAQAIYLEILTRFPDALEAPEARAALQQMKEKSRDSSALVGADRRRADGA